MSMKIGPQTLTLLFVEAAVHSESNQTAVDGRQRNKRTQKKLELKMFCQTYTARKPPKIPINVHSRHPVTPSAATEWSRLLLYEICSVWRTPYNALSMGMTQQFSRFCPW